MCSVLGTLQGFPIHPLVCRNEPHDYSNHMIRPWSTLKEERVADAQARGVKGTVCLMPETCGFCKGRSAAYLLTEEELLKRKKTVSRSHLRRVL